MVESFGLIFTMGTELGVLPTDILFLLWLLFLPENSCLFLHFSVALRLLIIETCSRMSIVAKLRSQNGSDQKWFLYVKKAMPGSLSPGISLHYLLSQSLCKSLCILLFLAGYEATGQDTWLTGERRVWASSVVFLIKPQCWEVLSGESPLRSRRTNPPFLWP